MFLASAPKVTVNLIDGWLEQFTKAVQILSYSCDFNIKAQNGKIT